MLYAKTYFDCSLETNSGHLAIWLPCMNVLLIKNPFSQSTSNLEFILISAKRQDYMDLGNPLKIRWLSLTLNKAYL